MFVFRYQYLLIEVGTGVLRKVFDNTVSNDFMQFLKAHPNEHKQLLYLVFKDVVSDTDKKFLPPIDKQPSSANFDISLLALLLRNVCCLRPRRDPVWTSPAAGDMSIEADITRLRMCRNELQHKGTVFLSLADFTTRWHELCLILHRLNNVGGLTNLQSDIDNAEKIALDEKLEEQLNKAMKEWDESDQRLEEKIGELESDVAGVKGDVNTITQDILGIKNETNTVKQGISLLTSDVTSVKQDVAGVTSDVATIKQNLVEVKGDSSFVKQDLVGIKSDVTSVREGMVGITSDITTVKQDIVGVKRQLDHVEKANKKVKPEGELSDIQKDLIDFYKSRCNTLPVSPLFENKDENILKIYKRPTMFSREGSKQIKRITEYGHIFCKDRKPCKQIYVTGDAGMGKTSFCTFMCSLWCIEKLGDTLDDSHKDLQKDVDYMSKFEFVFYINLRDTEHFDVIDMIKEQYLRYHDPLVIQDILRKQSCLILMDGLDEWQPKSDGKKKYRLPERIYSDSCVYITTCRPYRIENMRLSRRDVDHYIQTTGIHGDASESYVVDVINYMNNENSTNRQALEFMNDIRKCGFGDQLCIPMVVSHLVMLWFEKGLTGMPRSLIYANVLEMLFQRAKQRDVEFPPVTESKLPLPDCLEGFEYLNEYVMLLYNLCHLSFRALFKQGEHASSLVFTRQQLHAKPYCFSIKETDFLCKIGILSKNEMFGCYSVEKMKVSFIHKSYIEFCAALFISSFDRDTFFSDATKSWKTLNDVLQFEYFFFLLAGLSYSKVKSAIENVYSKVSEDLVMHRRKHIVYYGDGLQYPSRKQIHRFQSIVLMCFKEVSRSNITNIELKLEDYIFDGSLNDEILKKLLLLNITCLSSLESVNGNFLNEFCQITNLQSIRHLTSLSLSHIRMKHDSFKNLVSFLTSHTIMENIELKYLVCDDHTTTNDDCSLTLNLRHHTKLIQISLWEVNILCHDVNVTSLKSVKLFPLSEQFVNCSTDVLNRIKATQLECLDISGNNKVDCKLIATLTSAVRTLPRMKLLRLCDIGFPDDTSNVVELHPNVIQATVELIEVTMSRNCFESFIESVVNLRNVVQVMLLECKIFSVDGETQKELSLEESSNFISEHLKTKPVNITRKEKWSLHFETRGWQ